MTTNSYTYKVILSLLFFVYTLQHLDAQCSLGNGVIFVENTNDEGSGSLRDAINCANSTAGNNFIRFNISSILTQTIMVGETSGLPLPALTDNNTILDGTTQGNHGVNGDFSPTVILDGSAVDWDLPVNGLEITGSGCSIFGLEIRNFPFNGIVITNGDKNEIGAPNKGNIIYSCGEERDDYPMASPSGPYEGSGIYLRFGNNGVSSTTIYNNIIGTNEDFDPGLGNEFAGIRSKNNTIGNFIGFDIAGRRNFIYHNSVGVHIDNCDNSRISGNIFSCNDTAGIYLANGANQDIESPTISEAALSIISGTALSNSVVEVYKSDNSSCPGAACQGSIYLGVANASNGNWTLSAPFANGVVLTGDDVVTAINRSGSKVSAFAQCVGVENAASCVDTNGLIRVINTNDEGEGSLRQAILCANLKNDGNRIVFDIPMAELDTIFVGETTNEPLPTLEADGTIIDGSTQAGGSGDGRPMIVLDGSKANWDIPYNGIFVRADFCQINNLELIRFVDDAIDITSADNVVISNNVLHSNGAEQDTFPGVSVNTAPWEGSAINIKGNTEGCIIIGNTIGTDFDRKQILGNEFAAINITGNAADHTIGGVEAEEQNYFAHNRFGILIDENISGITITQNAFVCNRENGIEINPSANNGVQPPEIVVASDLTIGGTGLPKDIVQVYAMRTNGCNGSTGVCQGNVYIGQAEVELDSTWQLTGFANPLPTSDALLTSTSTSILGNTSTFGVCVPYQRSCQPFDPQDVAISILPDTCDLGRGSVVVQTTQQDTTFDNPFYIADVLLKMPPDSVRSIIDELDVNDLEGSVSKLTEGDYCIVIADFKGCTDTFEVTITSVGVLAEADFDFMIDELQGIFTNASDNATDYEWYINDSLVSEDVNLTYDFPATDIYDVCLVAIGTCNQDTICEELLVIATEDIPVFDIGEGFYSMADTGLVEIPVYVSSFYDMIGFQHSIKLENTDIATIDSVTNFNIPGLSTGNFTVSPDELLVQWGGFSPDEVTVPDSTVIFTIQLRLKPDVEACAAITFENSPTPIFSFRKFGNDLVEVPTITQPGLICKITRVFGNILRTDSIPVNFVTIYCNGVPLDTTQPDGTFSCVLTGDSLTVSPEKKINPDNGVKTFDLLLIQNHILNLVPLNSPYKEIAADATQDKRINVLDLLTIQNVILNQQPNFPNEKSWRFIDADYQFTTNKPLEEDWPESITVANNGSIPSDLDFIGIKLGDINLDNDPQTEWVNGDSLFVKTVLTSVTSDKATFEVRMQKPGNWLSFMFPIDLDENLWEFESVKRERQVLVNGLTLATEGEIRVLWTDNNPPPFGELAAFWEADELIMTIVLKRKGFHSVDPEFSLGVVMATEAVNSFFERGPVFINGKSNTVTSVTNTDAEFPKWIPFAPNPFIDQVQAELSLNSASRVEIIVQDANGRIVERQSVDLSPGTHQIRLNEGSNMSPGAYFVNIRTDDEQWQEKVIKLR